MPRHITFVFPGQGSQSLGMLDSLPENLVSKYKDEIVETLDFDLIDIIKNGDAEELNKTSITQPAILLTSFLYYEHISNLLNIKPNLLCGHSLGEYSALLVGGSLSFRDALLLVHKRGLLMEKSEKGLMYAILNTNLSIIMDVCNTVAKETNLIVSPANINTPNQVVVSGNVEAVKLVLKYLKEKGFRKNIKLNVKVPSHCHLMNNPAAKFKKLLDKLSLELPQYDVIHNKNAQISTSINDLKTNLVEQLTHPVMWVNIMKYIKNFNGIIIECGPGSVLSGLAYGNGINKNVYSTSSNKFLEDIKKDI
ncbi:MAG: [acyl-carrier-protein] S-malonyltransferase [Gammaproteobacteria bacterium]|nr:[acyl-carrier-protein] S-malonyltransferase [Gammaproteobacteria bacterium]|tara:strand:+ start:750 stop:1673 length:924 start_codon:yes stop_codon:yes gene_type:complete